ncbi:MAG TPA: LamG-like jellyroll fold domain-containing protein [Duganella sp.]
MDRRTFCVGSVGLAALGPLALAGCGGGAEAATESGAGARLLSGGTVLGQQAAPAVPATGRVFKHPGLLHTEADFDRMRAKVAAGAQPWADGWGALLTTGRSALSRNNYPRPVPTVIRNNLHDNNVAQLYIDVARAYQLAVRWKISGDVAFADQAVRYLDAWSGVLTGIAGNADRFLAAGIHGYQFANAAEIMRTYAGWTAEGLAKFQAMMLNVFYPLNRQFLDRHNDADITNYWANWDQCALASILAIGVLCDREDLYNDAVNYYKNGAGNGAASQAVRFIHPGYLGQWQESSRDQGHCTLGIGLAGVFCEMAWNQGDDLYGHDNRRFLAGAEYVAKSNLADAAGNAYLPSMPFDPYNNRHGTAWGISGAGAPAMRAVWEMIRHHYVNRLGVAAPYVTLMAQRVGVEGDGRNGDQLGVGTLTFTRDPIAAGAPPSGLTARLIGGQVELSWWGGAYATGYTVKRATRAGGPYASVASGIADPLTFTDSGMAPGTYYYVVTAVTPAGESAPSNEVKADTAVTLQTHLTAMSFDGAGQHVTLPADVAAGLADFTIAVKLYWNAARDWERVFDFGKDTSQYLFLTPRAFRGGAQFTISNNGGYGSQTVASPAPLPAGQWVHVALTLSGATATLYVNGAVAGTNAAMTRAPFRLGGTDKNWIGRSQFPSDPYFNGKVDDFRIYSGAMTAAQVAELAAG